MDLKNIFNVGYQGFPDGTVSFFSKRIVELTGYGNEEFNSKSLNWVKDLMNQEDIPQATESLKAALKGDRTYTRSYRIRTKSGAEKWILELAQIMCNSDGRMEFVTGTLIDITDEKHREREEEKIRRLTGKYLLVSLQEQQYGIPIEKIKEIIRMVSVTSVPNSPHYLKGLVNLRGMMIPVIDLGTKLNLGCSEETKRACIVVVEISCDANIVTAGIVVDSVSDAINIHGTDIEDMVCSITSADYGFLLGIAKIQGEPHILLDMDRIFSTDEFLQLNAE
ncbi:MAG: PAS domain S-box protein [Deltaproteobacteria bacterium]|nr:PAS domain S-box protein [Deltaproteobacteria bacterium]TLN01918.1 MAG: PAS domain S-box protein [bacterium]